MELTFKGAVEIWDYMCLYLLLCINDFVPFREAVQSLFYPFKLDVTNLNV